MGCRRGHKEETEVRLNKNNGRKRERYSRGPLYQWGRRKKKGLGSNERGEEGEVWSGQGSIEWFGTEMGWVWRLGGRGSFECGQGNTLGTSYRGVGSREGTGGCAGEVRGGSSAKFKKKVSGNVSRKQKRRES